MRSLARWHIWLGWLVGVPLLLWTFTGLWMVARPIEEVRGTGLRSDPHGLPERFMAPTTTPAVNGWPIRSITLKMLIDRPVWVIVREDEQILLSDATMGRPIQIDAPLVSRIANDALVRPAAIVSVRRFEADAAPLELRKNRPSWQIIFADGVHVYVDQESGEVLAVRSNQWRWFDVMWGLHIMDLQSREDTHHPLLIGFAALAFTGTLMGMILLFRRRKARPVHRSGASTDQ